jgi:hypothetical protein
VACSTHGEMRNMYKDLVGKPAQKTPLITSICEDNIKMYLRECFRGVDCIYQAQDMGRWQALVNTVMKLRLL